MSKLTRLIGSVTVLGVVAAWPAPASAQGSRPRTPTVEVVATGLNNPRGVTIGPAGVVVVAELGSGGTGPCFTDVEEQVENCLGMTGAVSVFVPGLGLHRIVTGLPSVARASGQGGKGLTRITFDRYGRMYGVVGLGAAPAIRDTLGPDGANLGRVLRLVPGRPPVPVADLAAYEATVNPAGDQLDTNPYGLVATPTGLVAVDAAANDVVQVTGPDQIRTVAVLPYREVPAPPDLGLPPGATVPEEPVPTAVTRGPDGALYVGLLPGFPFTVGNARVVRVVAGQPPTDVVTGLSNVIDVTFDRQGRMLVLELTKNSLLEALFGGDATSALYRIEADGSRTELAAGALTFAGGVAVAPDGSIYVTNQSVEPTAGALVRIRT